MPGAMGAAVGIAGDLPAAFRLLKASRVEHAGMWKRYAARREECARLAARVRVLRGRLPGAGGGGAPCPQIAPGYRREAEVAAGPDFAAGLEGLEGPALVAAVEEGEALLASMREGLEEMRRDLRSTREWETFDSGRETRDVLQNGERRAHMEARYGRKVRNGDVDYEQGLPWDKRRQLTLEGAAAAGPGDPYLPAEPVGLAQEAGPGAGLLLPAEPLPRHEF